MAIVRTASSLTSSSQAPLPPPIPTGKGSRSAADSIFSDYLNRSLKIPDLSLPESVHRSVPAKIDRRSLSSQEGDSVKRLQRSVVEFGAFRISGHGIRVDELGSAYAVSDSVFRISDDRRRKYCLYYGRREEFVWRCFDEAVAEQAREVIGAQKYRTFNQKMENVANELEAIAGELAKVISDSANKELIHEEIQPRESILSLYRYDPDAFVGDDPPRLSSDRHCESCCEQALSLHLLLDECEFRVQSEHGALSFNASPDTIVVTIGKQFEEWSLGEFKSAYGEATFERKLCNTGASYSIELKYSHSTFNHRPAKTSKTISLADQILFVIVIALLYKFASFILS
ncbi:2-oxoglutarate (2OG) and Fe(II)-dependent oxygenase superfamily protein [Actinidia rufa]|uniref:2-oxoglutarate (2OG) and Fe(II)-dependent oxygenase superfamily protein n=1 Tax=Actinidia rufa TaxID=165716 RepID=A0A7J0E952_9ERIC|nr:2-oxoglutarate (2OG) and Fe(II)-dependent oxygenase superfamily protein [Actinidia rufa]